jgi:Kef-type K+ transport system membrane component KefB
MLRTNLGLVANLVISVANNNHLLFLLVLSALGKLLGTWLKSRLNRVLRNDSLWWIAKLSLGLLWWGSR